MSTIGLLKSMHSCAKTVITHYPQVVAVGRLVKCNHAVTAVQLQRGVPVVGSRLCKLISDHRARKLWVAHPEALCRDQRAYSTMEKVGIAIALVGVAWTAYDVYKMLFTRPRNDVADKVLEAENQDRLAEEFVETMEVVGASQGKEDAVPVGVDDETPKLVCHHSRGVNQARKPYIRKVLDACKAKFGTPKSTEANFKAVWHFAHQQMKEHGVRPSHIAEMIPYVVQLTFVESESELHAGITVGAYRELIAGRFDQYLSRVERWTRKLGRAFGYDC